ncbi:MAG: IucA/IucC family siderophore biosynthesis protein [Actinomycetia bacterium]|nr:IucA/IucC family siderophore biosynthesis protein [Actinomycetes bacterium]
MTGQHTDTVLTALTPQSWARANRDLLAKAITELWYEEVIDPACSCAGELSWGLPGGTLTGRAHRRALGWWRVDPESLAWATERGRAELPGAADLLADVLAEQKVAPATLANLVAELSSTLVSDAMFHAYGGRAADLVDREPVEVEAELRGHPWIIANKGRVGFDLDDLLDYAPESGRDVSLLWVGADRAIAETAQLSDLDHRTVVREQVGDEFFDQLEELAAGAGLDPDTCAYVPVHPWQWANRIATLHAGDLACGRLKLLGQGPARYRPQLAIRTMTDVDHPSRRYLKLPVSVLNTSVYRGLPRERTLAAPALTEWLSGVVDNDPFIAETGMILLGEVAGVGVRHRTYEAIEGVPYQHTEMLGAIWRDPVSPHLHDGEHAVSLAALLHADPNGDTFVRALVERSGLSPSDWLRQLHEAVLPPLFHVLYRYGVMFSPHGQNCMIVHRGGVPTRLVVKDFVDDLAVCSDPLPEHSGLTAPVRAALSDVTLEPGTLIKYLQNGLLICVYRYLAEIMESEFGLAEKDFWASARATLRRYQDRHADTLSERYSMFDLQAPSFPKLCLNRLRLFERGYADDADRPVIAATGVVANPLAPGFVN